MEILLNGKRTWVESVNVAELIKELQINEKNIILLQKNGESISSDDYLTTEIHDHDMFYIATTVMLACKKQ